MNIIGIIPARGGSKSIKNKNIIPFCGKPLINWSIDVLKCSVINSIYVSTDNNEIANVARANRAEIISRPDEIAGDTATTESALIHALSVIQTPIDYVVLLQATSPVRTKEDIMQSVALIQEEQSDSLFSATQLTDACIWNDTNSITYNYKNRGRRQDRKPLYLENGSIYIFRPEILKVHQNRLGGKISKYFMPMWKSFEIDEPEDIELCETFMKRIKGE